MNRPPIDNSLTEKSNLDVYEAFVIYERHSQQYVEVLSNMLNHEFKNLQHVVRLLIYQMADRVVYGVQNGNAISSSDSLHCEIDLAALNRSIFETIVTLIFIVKQDSDSRFLSYYMDSIETDLRRIREVKHWEKHPDLEISASAHVWLSQELTTEDDRRHICRQFNVTPSQIKKLPHVLNRAKEAGDIWAYLYDTRYRESSGWSHGHISRIWTSGSYHQQDMDAPKRASHQALVMTSWTVEMLFRLIESLSVISKKPEYVQRAEGIRENLYEEITPILDHNGFGSSVDLEET